MSIPRCSWLLALALCLSAGCDDDGPVAPTTETRSFSSTAAVEVVADTGAHSIIDVSGFPGTITHVEVTIEMESLTGTVCEWGLGVSHPDGSGAALMDPDASPSCRTSIVTTFPTQTQPLASLDVFNGKTAEGKWVLSFGIEDGSYRDPVRHRIRLNRWTLTITNQR